MTIGQFREAFKKMIETYGAKVYPSQRVDMFYRRYSSWDYDLFSKAIDLVIANSLQPALVERFGELTSSVAKEQNERNKAKLDDQIKNAPDCDQCDKRGSFLAKYWCESHDRYYTTCFTCDCRVGYLIKDYSSVPVWHHNLADKFFIKGRSSSIKTKGHESDEVLLRAGFPASMIASGRIIAKLVWGQDRAPKGLRTVRALYSLKDEDYFEICEELRSGTPKKWAKHFSKKEPQILDSIKSAQT